MLREKIQTAPFPLPMLLEGQPFVDTQDELSVTQFKRKYGIPEQINKEVFIDMAKALNFINIDRLSMTVIFTAMNHLFNESNSLQLTFLDFNQPDRLYVLMADRVKRNSGSIVMSSPMKEIVMSANRSINHLLFRLGENIVAGKYVSAMPMDIVKQLLLETWQIMPFSCQLDNLEDISVINLHIWFNRKLMTVDHLYFIYLPLLSMYANMSVPCKKYKDNKFILELVFAP